MRQKFESRAFWSITWNPSVVWKYGNNIKSMAWKNMILHLNSFDSFRSQQFKQWKWIKFDQMHWIGWSERNTCFREKIILKAFLEHPNVDKFKVILISIFNLNSCTSKIGPFHAISRKNVFSPAVATLLQTTQSRKPEL